MQRPPINHRFLAYTRQPGSIASIIVVILVHWLNRKR